MTENKQEQKKKKNIILIITIGVVLAIFGTVILYNNKEQKSSAVKYEKHFPKPIPAPEKNGEASEKLTYNKIVIGKWKRSDGNYTLDITKVDENNGNLEAKYFNPNDINISEAKTAQKGDEIRVYVELMDEKEGYSGSKYYLLYRQDKKILKGIYYHGLTKQNYQVEFFRLEDLTKK
jgi:hypothetical protein